MYVAAMISLVLGVIVIILIVVYVTVWSPIPTGPSCQNNSDCLIGQICQRDVCVEHLCTTDDECENGVCVAPYCYAARCENGNDCGELACVEGACVTTGATCGQNGDCRNLNCLNGRCVQCQVNSDCPVGQGCFNQACRYPYPGETGTNLLFYPSMAQGHGNITAPPGYFCSKTICGNEYRPCGLTGQTGCGSSCPYCINAVCRCTAGELYETCAQNSDCLSGLCSETQFGRVCVPPGGACAFHYSVTGCSGCCPVPSEPYCVAGKCSATSLGAMCGSTGSPPNLCNNPSALTGIPNTGISPDGMGFFCVNGTCQEHPGTFNQQCTPGSCQFLTDRAFVCAAVMTPTITEMRCLQQI